MTNEENLDWLYRLRSEIYVYMPKEWLIPMNNALDEAIKKLEQSNSDEDCISRADAIANIRILYPDMPVVDIMGARHKWSEKYQQYRDCEKILADLPSIQPKPKTECSCEQIKWERDIAIEQLHELGYELGQKIEPCEDCISRAEAINAISHAELSFQVESDLNFENYKREVQEIADGILKGQVKAISDLPNIQPKTDVLDKIMKEIKEIYADIDDVCIKNGLNLARRIINKYKAESEDKE